jgi:signal transduction histidine kinase
MEAVGAGQAPQEPGRDLPDVQRRAGRDPESTQLLEAERAVVVARLVGAVFAVLMVSTYDAEPFPPGVQPAAYALAGLLAISTLPVLLALGRVTTLRAVRSLGLATLVMDAAMLVAFVWLFAFDETSVHFLLFFVLPAEAALKFRLVGAIGAWLVATGSYIARAVWASAQYGYTVNLPSITFRMGILLLVALVMGLFAQRLSRHSSELRRTLQQLEAEERWRTALIDMLAHDLRSPLTTTSSALDLLQRSSRDALDDEQRLHVLRGASRQNQQALSLTEDLLELARARQGHLELRRSDVNVEEELRRVVEQLADTSDWLSIVVEGADRAHLDPARLRQILTNLLSNARKHGRPPVTVWIRVQPDETLVRVSDNGPGLTDEERATVFAPLHAGPRADSVGLGLWIVHTLATAHGGTASYTTTDGQPTFEVRLPHHDPAPPPLPGADPTALRS